MAEPESILQLGIEAARDGNKEEARSLFRLLTRQEPQNAQAWLWLAGVAENRAERQSALEHVVRIEPDNEMAIKGLQALGVEPVPDEGDAMPGFRKEPDAAATGAGMMAAGAAADSRSLEAPAPSAADQSFDDDDPFAELDALSDVINEDPGSVRRADLTAEEAAEMDAFDDLGAAMDSSRPPPRPERKSAAATPPAYEELASASARSPRRYQNDDGDYATVPARSGPNPLLVGLVIVALLALLLFFFWPRFFGGDQQVAQNPTAMTQPTADPGTGSGEQPAQPGEQPAQPGEQPAQPGEQPAQPGEQPAQPGEQPAQPGEQPAQPEQPTQPPVDVSDANPQIVPANTPLQSEGWLYDFNRPNYAAPIVGNIGTFQPQGRFVVVLAFVVNNTGQVQPIPPDFFVLKDAQGRVYEALPEVSSAYVVSGVNADLSHPQPVPADGLTRSVALIFDVAPDATDLMFFARSNPQQGWVVLSGF